MKSDVIIRAHGSGGQYTHDLIQEIFIKNFSNKALGQMADGAVLENPQGKLCFSTDSHVIRPLFYPGGNIGKLAVAGTVNDLAVCGAKPLWLSCGFIIEEGFLIADLEKIAKSMRKTAAEAGVQIVTGDTKVVNKGEADGVYINTAGIGVIDSEKELSLAKIEPGDKVIVSGFIGDHEAAILAMREEFDLSFSLESDCTVIAGMTQQLVKEIPGLRIMRDPTRGGLATTLNEFTERQNWAIRLFESKIPVRETVRGLCEPLGFDPLYMANEGKVVAVVSAEDAKETVEIMHQFEIGKNAAIIGEITSQYPGRVFLKTLIGTERIVDMLSGEMLPRIC